MSHLLEINNLDVKFDTDEGRITAIDNVSLTLDQGKVLGIVGESGSGKSTAARVITGLLPQTSGSVTFDNSELPVMLAERSKEQKRRIQMIYQMADTAMNPRQTVRDIIGRPLEFYLTIRGEEKVERTIDLLKMIELNADFLERLPAELSGGQKQRVAIARALAANPKVLLADEPTGALDSATSIEVMALIQKINNEGKTILVVTHENDIAKMCKRIVHLRDGVIVEDKKIKQNILKNV